MSTAFYGFVRRSLPSSVAAATATTFVTALTFSTADEDRFDSNDQNLRIGAAEGMRRGPGSNGILANRSHLFSPAFSSLGKSVALCEAPLPESKQQEQSSYSISPGYKPSDPAEPTADPAVEMTGANGKKAQAGGGISGAERDGLYQGLFPKRQLWRPRLEYPLWDSDWDGRSPPPILSEEDGEEDGKSKRKLEAQRERNIRKKGVTRHIILIRHGQYDETFSEDSMRLLTPLGRKQAELTGRRLGELIRGVNENFGPCRVKVIHVSDLARAKETADIIYDKMDLDNHNGEIVKRTEPDPLLNEGTPCHTIPGRRVRPSVVERIDDHHPRIEQAFRKYFYRADVPALPPVEAEETGRVLATSSEGPSPTPEEAAQEQLKPHPQHEFEIIVCHGNVIRYFFCRALQLPPESWLRLCTFNCSLTYFTIRSTGTVSCRMLGDIGHLPYDMCTFSMHTGFNW